MKSSLLQSICLKHHFKLLKHEAVSGGDINQAYKLETDKGHLFIKLNDAAAYPEMLQKEAEGLKLLRETNTLRIPKILGYGELETQQYLLLEWINPGTIRKDFWKNFGESLAALHQHTQDGFGLGFDNYIGSLPQANTACADFASFYWLHRLEPMVKRLFDSHQIDKADVQSFETLGAQLHNLIPEEPPALVHGDLWAGNFLVDDAGNPVLIDPAPYYGHREMDIAMTQLFGGFDRALLEAYQNIYPLQTGWKERIPLFQLYPVLVHAVLFGGEYVAKAKGILQQYE